MPFLGAGLAVVFHEFAYKKVSQTITESEGGHEHNGLLDDDVDQE